MKRNSLRSALGSKTLVERHYANGLAGTMIGCFEPTQAAYISNTTHQRLARRFLSVFEAQPETRGPRRFKPTLHRKIIDRFTFNSTNQCLMALIAGKVLHIRRCPVNGMHGYKLTIKSFDAADLFARAVAKGALIPEGATHFTMEVTTTHLGDMKPKDRGYTSIAEFDHRNTFYQGTIYEPQALDQQVTRTRIRLCPDPVQGEGYKHFTPLVLIGLCFLRIEADKLTLIEEGANMIMLLPENRTK